MSRLVCWLLGHRWEGCWKRHRDDRAGEMAEWCPRCRSWRSRLDEPNYCGNLRGTEEEHRMSAETFACPRCGGTDFTEVDCGPDGWDDDITYTSEVCRNCGLWHDGWKDRWYIDVESWRDVEDADEYTAEENTG